MRLWIDDERDPKEWSPMKEWVWAKSAEEALDLLDSYIFDEVSFDHDLGSDEKGIKPSGYYVACVIEEMAALGLITRFKWSVHSANPVGYRNIIQAFESIERFWSENEKN